MPAKYKTVKQLSDQIGVSKPAITKFMTETFRSKYTKKQGNRLLIDSAGERVIKAHFKTSVHVKSKTNQKDIDNLTKSNRKVNDNESLLKAKDETIELLKKQLATKDEQLKRRADEITSMHKLMDQNQQLLLNTQEENKRLLALQAPVENAQNVQEGDFQEKTTNSSSKKQTPSTEPTETKKNTAKSWWHFW
ncbi:hypothetical protein LMB76_07650 [Limosilactobacillus reuteri]|uniref:DUF536 domain-containing protein n=1 Tax=Limosilactobacillus reuteri TaxID=1598 RepID=A0AAW4X6V3_LIMRT|nr:hypothetical protein [Limosilactobacillus reuteri]MCC4478089.1 hypothetical protein [Limosilactobacillus reuteri]MCC4480404.1 hypothetical protein [Limosilactobacillus reuteri]MCC4489324.1 hypothetical protein [Limosilactobacillus reuteri]MCC4493214.1 hypothetical protein [Limosilactobacillus reuteri]MCC4495812.1 hypothetical protein [Limosilactobacillus reuteri]